MKIFFITSQKNPTTNRLLKEAAEELQIEYEFIFEEEASLLSLPSVEEGDAMYRVTTKRKGVLIEQKLFIPGMKTFYVDPLYGLYKRVINPDELYEKSGISVPKQISLNTTDKETLKDYANYVGGFPLILKALGGSHGVGVMKIDSEDSFFSVADYVVSNNPEDEFVLKQYITSRKHVRLIVLGDKVIDSIEYQAKGGDFRTNTGSDPTVTAKSFSQEVNSLAVQAVLVKGREFGGVDIIFDEEDNAYLLEVNSQCFFGRAQLLTGTPVAKLMIEYLMNK